MSNETGTAGTAFLIDTCVHSAAFHPVSPCPGSGTPVQGTDLA